MPGPVPDPDLASGALADRLGAMGGVALEALRTYLSRAEAGEGPVLRLRDPRAAAEELGIRPWIERGGMDLEAFATFLDDYLSRTTKLHHPGFVAHQVAAPLPPSAIADLVNGATNNGMAVFEMGPPAVALELAIVDWMLEKAEWDAGSGVLTHGGSLANLTALLAARARVAPEAWEEGTPRDLVLLAPAASHYCIERAAGILGLGRRALVDLPVDENQVVRAEALPGVVEKVEAEGRRVLAVVANACATATGLYDPLLELGKFCRSRDLWFHVDGAHGGSALLSATHRRRLDGLEHADSFVWDAHKMLQTSGLCAALLVRDAAALPAAFQQQIDYLVDGSHEVGPDLVHRAVECTKAPLGLKVFLNLAVHGESGIAAMLDRQYALARELHAMLGSRAGFEVPYAPESNILCFRSTAGTADTVAIRARLLAEGRHYLTSATLRGRRHLRVTLMSPATDRVELDRMLDAIEFAARG